MNFVVGSGPAGVSAAEALLARGEEVCLVDAGLTLEPERRVITERMAGQRPEEWDPADVARMKEGMKATTRGVVLKRVFGSDFAYRGPAEHIAVQTANSALMPSLAQGGLSNVWGAAMMPYSAADLAHWPITSADLAPHYAAVLRLSGLAAQVDDLAEIFPLVSDDAVPLPMSRQARRLWSSLERHRPALRSGGVQFGAARLALQARRTPEDRGCVTCGMCMYGCPYDFIYSSAHTIRRWRERPRFQYVAGIVVERAEETPAGITLSGYQLHSREPWSATGERAFLAAGVLPTTKILLTSQEAYGRPLTILDSQYFLFPLLQAAATRGVREEALYTLSQIFLEISDPAVSLHTVHLQVYSYNDLITGALRQSLGPLAWDWLVGALEERLLVVQGYLHSSHSSSLRAVLHRGPGVGILRVEAETNAGVPARVRKVVRKLAHHARQLGAFPLEPLLQIATPGRGFHSGGTVPMREKPAEFESDTFGRPHGWQRLHVVDSSIFPSIAAPTITYTVMANAHRIASAVMGS